MRSISKTDLLVHSFCNSVSHTQQQRPIWYFGILNKKHKIRHNTQPYLKYQDSTTLHHMFILQMLKSQRSHQPLQTNTKKMRRKNSLTSQLIGTNRKWRVTTRKWRPRRLRKQKRQKTLASNRAKGSLGLRLQRWDNASANQALSNLSFGVFTWVKITRCLLPIWQFTYVCHESKALVFYSAHYLPDF